MPRSLWLPPGVAGRVSLHSMPGANGSFDDFLAWAAAGNLDAVICLNPGHELRRLSPIYAEGVEKQSLPWRVLHFPIDDFGVPDDPSEYVDFVLALARQVRDGDHVLIHCMMGIGRTGTTAAALLMALGVGRQEACRRVSEAGSQAESALQRELLELIAQCFEAEPPN